MTFDDQSTDQTLIQASIDGDDDAFRILVDRFIGEVARTVTGMLGSVAEVDDVVQEVFIKLHRALGTFRGDATLKTFVIRMSINKSLDALRRRKRTRWLQPFTVLDEAEPESSIRTDEVLTAMEKRNTLRRAIDSLPDKQRSVIVLRLIEEMSTEEAANVLGVPYGTVLSRLKRGIDKLKIELGESALIS